MKVSQAITRYFLLPFLLLTLFGQHSFAQDGKPGLAKEKQTTPGLYVTSREAYEKWKAAPDRVKILDVRTPEEYLFVGHAPMAWNIPAFIQSYEWDAEKQHFPMLPVHDFVSQVKRVFSPTDAILVTCRSDDRSAMATHQLAAAGFKFVYNITDGVEGALWCQPQVQILLHKLLQAELYGNG